MQQKVVLLAKQDIDTIIKTNIIHIFSDKLKRHKAENLFMLHKFALCNHP